MKYGCMSTEVGGVGLGITIKCYFVKKKKTLKTVRNGYLVLIIMIMYNICSTKS